MIVLDASVVVEILQRTALADQLEARLFVPQETWHAPELIDLEVAQVLRRSALAGTLPAEQGALALADLGNLPLIRHPHTRFLERIWQLRHNLTACDAAYVALAEALGALLLTRDSGIASSPGHRARIELV